MAETDGVIDEMVKLFGLTERNILQSLTDQQCRVWVHWAILGRPESEIAKELFSHCKNPSAGSVRPVIKTAQAKIVAQLLSDVSSIKEFLEDRPQLSSRIGGLLQCIEPDGN